MLTVKITPNDKGTPSGKLADAELHFTDPTCPACQGDQERTVSDSGPLAEAVRTCATCDGRGVLVGANPLAGLRLLGFAIWERRTGAGRNVTFPARTYSVNGERRSFSLLRPLIDTTAQESIREMVLDAFVEFELQTVEAV